MGKPLGVPGGKRERGEATGAIARRAKTGGFRAARGKRNRSAGRFRTIWHARGRNHRARRAPTLRCDLMGESRPAAPYALADASLQQALGNLAAMTIAAAIT